MGMRAHGGPRSMMGQKYKRSRPMRVLLGRTFSYLGKFRRIVAIGTLLSFIATIVSLFDPFVLQSGIDTVFDSSSFFR